MVAELLVTCVFVGVVYEGVCMKLDKSDKKVQTQSSMGGGSTPRTHNHDF